MKKRKLLLLIVAIATLLMVACSVTDDEDNESASPVSSSQTSQTKEILEMELIAYSYAISTFEEVTVDEAYGKIGEGDDFFLYVGRPTCEWCRKLVPVISQVALKRNITIYYLDSTNTDSDNNIRRFGESFRIKNVPSILKFSSDGTYFSLEYDLNQSREELAHELNNLLQ